MENFNKRNEDFFNVVCKIQREGVAGRPVSVHYAVRKAIGREAPSFYLTREHVWNASMNADAACRRKRNPTGAACGRKSNPH